uniref:LDL receptor related protein 1B n=1 Tax=Myotis lucifugus TaxID=59463 RepID=G1Q4X7_MYOLU
KLFFTDYGNVAKVERCDMDGINRTRIIDSKTEQPAALALDLVNKLVYWVDLYLDCVEVVDYQGKNRHTIIQGRQQTRCCHWNECFEDFLMMQQNINFLKIRNTNAVNSPSCIKIHLAYKITLSRKSRRGTFSSLLQEVCLQEMGGSIKHLCQLSLFYKRKVCECRSELGSDRMRCRHSTNNILLSYAIGFPGELLGIFIRNKISIQIILKLLNVLKRKRRDFHKEWNYDYCAVESLEGSLQNGKKRIDTWNKLSGTRADLDNVEGIAVDWIGHNLYWTNDGSRKTINVARLEKAAQSRKTLLEGEMSHPRGIVVDPVNGWMYWTDWEEDEIDDSVGRIEKAWMDGFNRQIFVTSKMLWPNGLTLDFHTSTLYWCDAYYDHIEKVFLNGTHRKVVYSGKELNHPFGLSHHGNYVFWTDYMNGSIFQLDLITNVVTLLRRERPPLFGLQIYDPRKQQGDNMCRVNNGGCSTLCLAIPGGRVCACADNQLLDENRTTCT